MGTIAQGMITLTSVNDAFSVLLSPSSCVINADYNGKNPKLTYAYSDIKVVRGETEVAFDQPKVLGKTNAATVNILKIDDTTWRVQITSIPTSDLSGSFQLEIKVGEDFQTVATFSYTVVRETSMLDWILDWNGTYTQIAGKWIITPKIFAGTKDAQNRITGVYIGPSFDNDGSTGLYGYKNDDMIFKLTETGGMIGGWQIENGGIQTSDGYLKILSEGSIISAPKGELAWGLYKDGSATFANGNVAFYANGDASFSGRITSQSGQIGGWYIGQNSLYHSHILLDANNYLIGIRRSQSAAETGAPDSAVFASDIEKYGGIKMFYSSLLSYGLECYTPSNTIDPNTGSTASMVFSLGHKNKIAGWNFDYSAIYIGTKNNTARQNTSDDGDITIGTNGLRGKNWYIDTDGEISFVGGLLHFDKDGGTIAGWSMTANTFISPHVALTSYSSNAGLFLSASGDFSNQPSSNLTSIVSSNGGLFIKTDASNTQLSAYAKINNSVVRTILFNSNGSSMIAAWYFNNNSFYRGTENNNEGEFTSTAHSVTIGSNGIRGYKWRLESTGAGAIAGGNIVWTADGKVTFNENVWLSWNSATGTGTRVTSAGVFTGTISADNITAGTISTASIKCEGKWALNTDGSGYLASKNITWTKDGDLSILGDVAVRTLRYYVDEGSAPWDYENATDNTINDAFRIALLGGDCEYKLPHLEEREFRVIKFLGVLVTRSGGSIIFHVSNNNDNIYFGTRIMGQTPHKSFTLGQEESYGLGYYEIIGYSNQGGSSTTWQIIKLSE